jgi:hypothetical protein
MSNSRLAAQANPSGPTHPLASTPTIHPKASWKRRASAALLSLIALSASASALTLQWDPNPETNIDHYQLSYGTSSGSYTNNVPAGANTSVAVTGLNEGTTYYFVVTAFNTSGQQSAPSAEISYLVPATIPPPTQTFNSWTSSAGLSGAAADPLATPHNDGVPNLLKYAFNLDGSGPDTRVLTAGSGTEGLPLITLSPNGAAPAGMAQAATAPTLHFEFIRRKNSGLTYTPLKSPDLNAWVGLSATPTVTSIDTNNERVVIDEPCDSSQTAVFGRVQVDGNF